MSGTMRHLEERQLAAEITAMRWSPKMDLLAIANSKGEVALHRLTWQRVWLLPPQEEGDLVANLTWRPDGKLLAISYEKSKVLCLVDIENKNIIHKTQLALSSSKVYMVWLPMNNIETDNIGAQKISHLPTGEYLPTLPSLNRSFGQEPERKDFWSRMLDMLFIGQDDGSVVLYVFGMFYCGTLNIGHGPVLEITGGSGDPIWVSWKDNDGIGVGRLSCPLLEKDSAFLQVARAQAHITCLMDYLSRTWMAISEAWETILLEMDEKLTRYAESNPPGGVAADFLELLMIGIPTPNLENFLLRDLTEKGLKKLGHSIEMCYSNIQKLVLKHLSSVGMALVYQLSEMRGMARLGGSYEALGLKDETPINNALHASQAFLAKSSEIKQVIDHSMRDYKAFFRWLYVVILRLTDERVPSEVSRVSQQELTFIADFLRGFDKTDSANGGERKGVNLEKLGQYLRRESLQTCLTPEGSEWASMLDENHCLKDHPLIIKQDLSYSLLQSHAKLVDAISGVFTEAYQGLVSHFTVFTIGLGPFVPDITSQIVTQDKNLLIAAADSERKHLRCFKVECIFEGPLTSKLSIIDIDRRQGMAACSKSSNDTTIADLQFYNQDYLSLLLLNPLNYASFLIQVPVSDVRLFSDAAEELINLSELLGTAWPRPFQGISARHLAVSGSRKVAAILSETNRKIRLLETEVEPEDEEDEEESTEQGDESMDTSGAVASTSQ
ncbi:anaphase-promoting complex subunit 4 [Orussus abietinus]|uniref:anaphase-promoting complex subunit 4 n=1 Tax=Orussus abietinus TaxID=222816 RepID=UPI0006251C9A|nr:anaphase-promoting complex subunit 4 [Orussus abietinus]XP_012279697.1 anaphase-promoting complex subunit 4 [Orussus abietinus]XP_023289938.1 anaphase-promoting complex subunit 4 [Orussus abietinus]